MKNDDLIYVAAAEGRIVPFHPSDMPDGVVTTGGQFQLKPEDGPMHVPNTTGNRRKIRSGDLVVEAEPVDAKKFPNAAALAEDLLDPPTAK